MNPNRSGTSQLSMSVAKLRSLLHAAYIAGQATPPTVDVLGDDGKRREYIRQALIDLNWR